MLENDCFIPRNLGGGDNDFTHGTGFEYVSDGGYHFRGNQNMYAPSDLTRSDHIVGDRPYAGLLLFGIGKELFRNLESPWSHYAELDFGMIGPAAFCGPTQRFIHKILDCRKPMGWDNQLHNEFVVNGQWWTKYNWFICDYVALVPRIGVLGGTIQDAVEVGCDLKVGWNMRKDYGSSIMFSSTARKGVKSFLDDISACIFVGADERYYLYNHILEGTLFGHRDDGLGVDIEPFVGEIRCGAELSFRHFFVKYYMIFRQDEFKNQKNRPNYGGLVFGWNF